LKAKNGGRLVYQPRGREFVGNAMRVARCNLGARPRASRPRHKERVLRILGRRGIYQGTSGRFDAILSTSGRRRRLKNKKAHDGSCALGDLGGAFPAAG
jgi:hypothetical protein